MKKGLFGMVLVVISAVFANTAVFANEQPLDAELNSLREAIIEDGLDESVLDEAVKIREGAYQIGEVVYVDAQVVTDDTGKMVEVITRGTSIPTKTWDWASGNYSTTFDIDYTVVFTDYLFTGYSQYYVDAYVKLDTHNGAWPGGGGWKVECVESNGSVATSYSSSTYDKTVSIRFYNLDAGKKYCFTMKKANDGSNISGTLKVYK